MTPKVCWTVELFSKGEWLIFNVYADDAQRQVAEHERRRLAQMMPERMWRAMRYELRRSEE